MKIKMLHTRYGSEDGFTVQRFEAGKEYTVTDTLGAYFIREFAAFNNEDESVSEIVLEQLGLMNSFNYRQPTNPDTLQALGIDLTLNEGEAYV